MDKLDIHLLNRLSNMTPSKTRCDAGVYGDYTPGIIQTVFGADKAKRVAEDGSGYGNFDGLAYGYAMEGAGTEGSTPAFNVVKDGAVIASIGVQLWTDGDYHMTSDKRLKDDIESIDNALDKVCTLGGYTFTRNDRDDGIRKTGVIAQEVVKVLPEAVMGGPTEENPDGLYSVAYASMIGLLIESIKELNDKCSSKDSTIETLSTKVDELSNKINSMDKG